MGGAAALFGGYNYGKQQQRSMVRAHVRQAEAAQAAALAAKDAEIGELRAKLDAAVTAQAKRCVG